MEVCVGGLGAEEEWPAAALVRGGDCFQRAEHVLLGFLLLCRGLWGVACCCWYKIKYDAEMSLVELNL